jgi:hypothetical protein
MYRNKQAGKARLMTAASILTLALVALPFEPSLDGVAVDGTAAHAKGNGGGHGGGPGGGNSGHGGADTDSAAGSAADSGRGHGKAGAPGQNKDGASGFAAAGDIGEADVAKNYGATVSMMGGLNSWSNASANARAHASSNSQVGLAATYENAILGGDIGTAIESLLAAANKPASDETQAQAVVQSINAALGITVEGAIAETEVVEEPEVTVVTEAAEGLTVAEDPADTEETEVVDTETTETTETVQSRSISQATEDAVVVGFLARDSSLGETEGDGTIDVSETTPEDGGAIGDETVP